MKKIILSLIAILSLVLAGCSVDTENVNSDDAVQIANPASQHCIDNGGSLDLQTGMCTFENGIECEEWAFFRGECSNTEELITDFDSCVEAGNPTTRSIPAQCNANGQTYVQEFTKQEKCELYNGSWVESANECEYIGSELCEEMGGQFNECGSACRNDPEAVMCTMQCVPFCSFN